MTAAPQTDGPAARFTGTVHVRPPSHLSVPNTYPAPRLPHPPLHPYHFPAALIASPGPPSTQFPLDVSYPPYCRPLMEARSTIVYVAGATSVRPCSWARAGGGKRNVTVQPPA
jgi:hypothetical protein